MDAWSRKYTYNNTSGIIKQPSPIDGLSHKRSSHTGGRLLPRETSYHTLPVPLAFNTPAQISRKVNMDTVSILVKHVPSHQST